MMIEVDNMSDAVQMAQRLSEKGDTVLLSPACASFDLFEAMKTEENNLNKI
jgi:UDP-N-acetylmuramoylalanine--D-glutamate ligase